MKTLDEVIEALEICSQIDAECDKCPYKSTAKGWCEEKDRDALHYLREYKKYTDTMCALPDYYDWVHSADNPPLSWDELRQMEGKPVWVERCDGDTKGWLLILRTNYDVITCTTKHGNSFYLYKNHYCEKWQAYRKEQNVD